MLHSRFAPLSVAVILVFAVCFIPLPMAAQSSAAMPAQVAPRTPTPDRQAIQQAEQKDRQHLLDQLGIKDLRAPSSHSNPGSPVAANYDEVRANVYKNVPDPLALNDGKPVTSARMWWTRRRPQIVADFNRDVLGFVPAHTPKVAWEIEKSTDETIGGVPAVAQKLVGSVDNSTDPAIADNIHALLVTPAKASGPVPVIVELSFSNEFDPIWDGAVPAARPGDQEPPWEAQVLAKGWGYAMLEPTSFQADNGAGLDAGIIGLMDKGQPRSLTDWGALRAWAWGASRLLDYLKTDKAVDGRQVGIMGHSRFGKTALVAMAYDPRFAIAYISSSGEGGAKLYRHVYGEEISNLTELSEYHWFDGEFLKYGGPLNAGELPVDANELIALCAPRPVFIGAGNPTRAGDGWADPEGEFLAAAGANRV
ncbi:MAG: alpha/beta hydrolase family protein, partial [Terracidiphilus sp.]